MEYDEESTIEFEIVGSQGDVYVITIYNAVQPHIMCTCPAAMDGGTHCKHRLEILEGNFNRVLHPENIDQELVRSIFVGSLVESAVFRFREAEAAQALAKRNRDKAARELAAVMMGRHD